jgi:hypothetical protein
MHQVLNGLKPSPLLKCVRTPSNLSKWLIAGVAVNVKRRTTKLIAADPPYPVTPRVRWANACLKGSLICGAGPPRLASADPAPRKKTPAMCRPATASDLVGQVKALGSHPPVSFRDGCSLVHGSLRLYLTCHVPACGDPIRLPLSPTICISKVWPQRQ